MRAPWALRGCSRESGQTFRAALCNTTISTERQQANCWGPLPVKTTVSVYYAAVEPFGLCRGARSIKAENLWHCAHCAGSTLPHSAVQYKKPHCITAILRDTIVAHAQLEGGILSLHDAIDFVVLQTCTQEETSYLHVLRGFRCIRLLTCTKQIGHKKIQGCHTNVLWKMKRDKMSICCCCSYNAGISPHFDSMYLNTDTTLSKTHILSDRFTTFPTMHCVSPCQSCMTWERRSLFVFKPLMATVVWNWWKIKVPKLFRCSSNAKAIGDVYNAVPQDVCSVKVHLSNGQRG